MTNPKAPNEMNEAELAEFYQAHKGDLSLWQTKPRPIRRRRGEGPSTSFAIRLTPGEIEELQAAAQATSTTLSDFIRSSALTAARAQSSEEGQARFEALSNQLQELRRSLDATEKELRRAV